MRSLYKWGSMIFCLLLIFFLTRFIEFNLQQTLATLIIALFIASTLFFWENRLAFAFIGVFLLMFFGVLDVAHFVEFAHLEIIVFLMAMMIIVAFLERHSFFEFIISNLIQKIGKRGYILVIVLLFISFLLAAIVDEVTSILIMTSLILHLALTYKVNPIPFILMTIFATNIGSAATVVGNPIGVMIALNAQLGFSDFLRVATPIAFLCLIGSIPVMFFIFRKDLAILNNNIKNSKRKFSMDLDSNSLRSSLFLFLIVGAGLIFHHQIENLFHLQKNSMLIGVALLGAGIALFLAREYASELVERRVDWLTLSFFLFLFASVGSLKYTGAVDIFGAAISKLGNGNLLILIIVLFLISGLLSAVLDNVLAVAIMLPVVASLSLGSSTLYWVLLFAGTLFGNLTYMGSTANIVALGILQKRGFGKIGFKQWLLPGIAVVFVTSIIALLLIVIQVTFLEGL